MLLYSLLLVLPASGLIAQPKETYLPLSAPLRRRQLMTCDQTYGNGSIPCGGADSRWCFNPRLDQISSSALHLLLKPTMKQMRCQLDSGFCSKRSYHASVAGYCCLEGEDLATCTQNAGFDLPGSVIDTAEPALITSTEINRPFRVTPFLAMGPRPTSPGSRDADKAVMTQPIITKAIGDSPACYQASSSKTPIAGHISNTTVATLRQLATLPLCIRSYFQRLLRPRFRFPPVSEGIENWPDPLS
ncbi:hypothetical protein GGR50DRAFT_698296 [Xylaria sp. CBS 124048]|nr:hypothetical protein GGR50DRAFT_698296 [Xylaria sp. CBS 124048]